MRLLVPLVLALAIAAAPAATTAASADEAAGGATTYDLGSIAVDGLTVQERPVVGEGTVLNLRPAARYRYFGTRPSPPRVRLEVRGPDGWTRVASTPVPAPTGSDGVMPTLRTAPLRSSAARSVLRYRVVSDAYADDGGSVTAASVSRVLTVVVEDQAAYRGLRRTAWEAVRPYCPQTAVRIRDLPGALAGRYTGGSRLLVLDPSNRGRDAHTIASVALHECAHQRQWLNYGATDDGWNSMQQDAARVYLDDPQPAGRATTYRTKPAEQPFVPLEHGADCASVAVEPAGYLGYGGWCDPTELREGRRLMRGERY